MPVLTGVDVLGIQGYVFASNRLRDAVTASSQVHWATASDGALSSIGDGEVLIASGGNVLLRFPDLEGAYRFVTQYTRRLYDKAPGIETVIVHRKYEPKKLAEALEQLQVALACAKLERLPSVPQLGLSVTAACRITGLPAIGFDPQDQQVPLSSIVIRWRDKEVQEQAQSRWRLFLPGDNRFEFPPEIDDMGRSRGDTSLLGVVHIDGNGVGQRIANWLRVCQNEALDDDTTIAQARSWSAALDAAGQLSLEAVVNRVTQAIADNGRIDGTLPDLGFDLKRPGGQQTSLPLRPVLLGGDDLTFLCDGRIALDLAEAAIAAFETDLPHLGKITACAGVAMAPAHTPFSRTYELAEALCRNAKRRRREKNDSGSWIDWHIGAPQPGESVDAQRKRAYACRVGSAQFELTCRPYRLGTDASERETWRWLSQNILGVDAGGFRSERWRLHRNKVKEFRSLVREGSDGVDRARKGWTVAANLALPGGLDDTNGFLDSRTPLLDAVELLDLYLPLREPSA